MGVIAQIAIGVLAITLLTVIAFFGRVPALRHTPIAWLHRVLMVHIPNGILSLDQRFTSGRLTSSCFRFGNRIMYGRHPTVLIFFFLLLSVSEYLFMPGAWPRLSLFHKIAGSVSIVLPYWFLYLSAYGDPGIITTASHSKYMSQYPYDFSLFHPGQICRTCQLIKPARSKHCAVCNRCVAKMDHHCIFINNCVGYGNHAHFILLLFTTAVLISYGAILGLSLISETIHGRHPGWKLWKPRSFTWHDYLVLLTFGIQEDVGIGSVSMLAMMTSPLVWGLLGYQLYLIYCGTTTNESMKWQDWKAEMDDGFAFKRAMASDRVKDPRWEAQWTRWPVESVQSLVRTEDGRPPPNNEGPGIGEWERVWNLKDVENLYDLGVWDNMVDVFVPGYSFRDAIVTDEERGRRSKKSKETRASKVIDAVT
ncbi:DHHC palmitoyltransferase-domain-containing protein [Pseudomassariella vexata]|uniref:Palmitoyltransferase n=1 Tax=Pseudomassariella vexata TaxID=1141098 RepID=A0A1Y2DQK9_9PEZI|nr:DHHC palmitoyltransferase-domain-containing protein [Pseudomassariella vexata]ORY61396.1 DHHC palmitoyltransferase-domain-containing protein [Pseudomassariella vexata]